MELPFPPLVACKLHDLGRANPAGDRTPSSVRYAHDADPAFETSSGVTAPAPVARRRSDRSRRVLDAVPARPHTGHAPNPRNPVERAPRSCPAATPRRRRRRLTLKGAGQPPGGCPGSDSLPVSSVRATLLDPVWRPKPLSLWPPIAPTLRQTLPRASPEPRRRLPVAPLIGYQRCYGEAPARLRRDSGGARVSARRRGRC